MRRAVVAVVLTACAVPLSGCVAVIEGLPSALEPPVSSLPAGEIVIVGASPDDPIDRLAANALADLQDFWGQSFPQAYGEDFPPLQGGYFSVDPGDVDESAYPDGVSCGADPLEVEGNAFYCQSQGEVNSDSISYDRAFLGDLAEQFGDFIPDLVMAHEFGHAVQGRAGYPPASILAETQADCFAGAWTAWVADGGARYTRVRAPELDDVLRGYLQLRDPVGTGLNEESAHGSYFDRVSAFQEGFSEGVGACRDNFGTDRVLTQQEFTDADLQTGGNAPREQLPDIVDATVTSFFAEVVDSAGGGFDPPSVESLDGPPSECAEDQLDYCEDERVVALDGERFGSEVYEIGDFALITAVAIPYALDARFQLGLSTDDADAIRSAVCSVGAYGRALFDQQIDQPEGEEIAISPGDVDEGVVFLLTYGSDPAVIPDVDLTGFQLVDIFRTGFTRGVETCGLR